MSRSAATRSNAAKRSLDNGDAGCSTASTKRARRVKIEWVDLVDSIKGKPDKEALEYLRSARQKGTDLVKPGLVNQNLLFFAARYSKLETFKWLVETAKLDINLVDTMASQTPLFWAVAHGSPEMAKLCLELKANHNVVDAFGWLPLLWARSVEVVELLVNAGSCLPEGPLPALFSERPPVVERFILACMAAKATPNHIGWSVRLESSPEGGQEIATYLVTHSCPENTDELCALQDEFLQDHQALTTEPPDTVYSWLSLSKDPEQRRRAVQAIAEGWGMHGNNADRSSRSSTLQCKRTTDGGKSDVTGYCYYVLSREEGEPNFTLKFSHLKVSQHFQRRGIGTLLMSAVLSSALYEFHEQPCDHVKLSVHTCNSDAESLYRKLSFVDDPKTVKGGRWKRLMQEELPGNKPPDLLSLRTMWLQKVAGANGCSFREVTPGVPKPPAAQRRKRRTPASPSALSPSRPAELPRLGTWELRPRKPEQMFKPKEPKKKRRVGTSSEEEAGPHTKRRR